jgi:type I restriction enzyme S subunit
MIADLKPYAKYRQAEGGWLGEIPSHWTIRRMKYVVREINDRSTSGKEQLLRISQFTGVTQRHRADGLDGPDTRAESLVGYKRVEPDDLVINIMLAWNGSMGVSRYAGIASPAYCVYRFGQDVHPWYFHNLLRSPDYKARIKASSTGVVESRLRLYSDDLGRIEAMLPPPAEQAAIVRFLDWASGSLERAIRAKRKVIALLNEQKQAIIHRAVTRGLDPSVRLKPSGIPWLGDIPQHWDVIPLKRTCSLVRDGTHLPPARTPTGFPLLSVRNMVGGRLVRRPDDSFISKTDFDMLNRSFVVRPQDVLMAIVGATLGKVAVVEDIGPFQLQRSVSILRPRPEVMAYPFLATFLRSAGLQEHLWKSVAFSAQPGIYLGFVANIPVPIPRTIAEQVAICNGLQLELAPVDTALSRMEREIDLLREYRTRLVADVVTGKLDVREAAGRLPDEAPPDIADDDPDLDEETEPGDEEAAA